MLLLEYDDDYFIFLNCRNLFDFFFVKSISRKISLPIDDDVDDTRFGVGIRIGAGKGVMELVQHHAPEVNLVDDGHGLTMFQHDLARGQ